MRLRARCQIVSAADLFGCVDAKIILFDPYVAGQPREPRSPSGVCNSVLPRRRGLMDGIIYLVGLIVIVMAILSFLGLR